MIESVISNGVHEVKTSAPSHGFCAVHKKMLAVVVSNVEVESEFQFERRMFGGNSEQLRLLAAWGGGARQLASLRGLEVLIGEMVGSD